jgi:hypothetical protein
MIDDASDDRDNAWLNRTVWNFSRCVENNAAHTEGAPVPPGAPDRFLKKNYWDTG